MQFSYRGFEQHDGIRKFKFAGVADKQAQHLFCFAVDLKLLTEHRVSLQETPALCVQLLMRALKDGVPQIDSTVDYLLGPDDMLAFTAPRRALALAHHNKKPTRLNRPKPSPASQVFGSSAAPFPA
jgi:hypothetical protein